MNWYKKAQNINPENIFFENNHTGYHNQQNDFILYINHEDKNDSYDTYLNESPLGYIEYSEFDNEIYLNMIEVKEKFQRQGIGTLLINELKRIAGEQKINWGMMTESGYGLQQKNMN